MPLRLPSSPFHQSFSRRKKIPFRLDFVRMQKKSVSVKSVISSYFFSWKVTWSFCICVRILAATRFNYDDLQQSDDDDSDDLMDRENISSLSVSASLSISWQFCFLSLFLFSCFWKYLLHVVRREIDIVCVRRILLRVCPFDFKWSSSLDNRYNWAEWRRKSQQRLIHNERWCDSDTSRWAGS